MLEIRNYAKPESLQEAWELNQKKSNCIIGGMMWLKMSYASVNTAIDLSGLGLGQIDEEADFFRIGCMTTLRDLEKDEALNRFFTGAVREAVRGIVGVQFRNLATIGGSIWGRYGFSDLLTVFLALDSSVELYQGGIVPLAEFIRRKKDRDLLVRVLVPKKSGMGVSYQSFRNTVTDLPVLNVSAAVPEAAAEKILSQKEAEAAAGDAARAGSIAEDGPRTLDFSGIRVTVGARPLEAMLVPEPPAGRISSAAEYGAYAASVVPTESNMRGSAEFRTRLVRVLTKRALVKAAERALLKKQGSSAEEERA